MIYCGICQAGLDKRKTAADFCLQQSFFLYLTLIPAALQPGSQPDRKNLVKAKGVSVKSESPGSAGIAGRS